MVKRIVYILFLVSISVVVFSQQKIKIDLKQAKQKTKNTEIVKNISNGLILSETISTFELVEKKTKEGLFSQLISDGMSKTFDEGKPDLPVVNRLIEIPFNSDAKIKVISFDEEIIELKDYGLTKLIIPAQPSHEKSKDIKDVPFIKDQVVYSKNEFFKKDIVKFEDKGYLRDKHLGYIEISPFAYNPVTNTLKILNNIEIEISFIPKQNIKHQSTDRLKSPYFENIAYNTINEIEDTKALISGPVKYVIVSDPMFEETLQAFVDWKTMKGFNVVEAYTDDADVGTTTTSIKTYLQDLYDNPDDGVSPTFVLLVGDVAQIPAFSGSGHVTDLYYCEYTGDKLPEVFYGRFSAETIEELQPQIDKTLEIEKYEMPDPSYLDNVVLVAGVDGTYAPTWGNGAINYANDNYTNTENGITSYYYLYNDNSGVMASNNSGASASIRSYISSGVALANYTAHCSSDGWANPGFIRSHIDELTNEHMYPLIIGNCCESSTFNTNDCFAEKILMAENKGAVGYIGGSNSTYWDEDYWWAIGVSSITANPTYEDSELGAYDRFFHLNEEAKEDWYITQGQINVAGNLAVEASTSSLKAYYWEIYHLMGDPSLTPYVTVPEALIASYNSEIITGSSSFQVSAEEDAYVAISKDGVLLDAQLVGATGVVELSFDPLEESGILNLVITKQNRQPTIDEITIVPATTPYVLLDYYIIDDLLENNNSEVDFGETIKLDIQLKNFSDTYDAFNVIANLISVDTNVILIDFVETFGTILKTDSSLLEASFTIDFKTKFSDQQKVSFDLEISGEDVGSVEYTWNSKINLTVNAPELEIGDLFIDDASGNNDGIVDPGETVKFQLQIENEGHAAISNLKGILDYINGSSYISISDSTTDAFTLNAGQSDTIEFEISVSEDESVATPIEIKFTLQDSLFNHYSVSETKEIVIGEISEFLISEEGLHVITTEIALFYDSGGPDAEYSNSENYTVTFQPEYSTNKLKVEFLSFSVEPDGSNCYDYLEVYDGENTSSTLIGSYCDANPPTIIVPTNDLGALTFKFYSDQSVTQAGWEAEISQENTFDLKFYVSDNDEAIENATVNLSGNELLTDTNGEALFTYVTGNITHPYTVTKEGYRTIDNSLIITEDTVENITMEFIGYNVTFNVTSGDSKISEVKVEFNQEEKYTDTDGQIIFTEIMPEEGLKFTLSKYGFWDYDSTLNVVDADVVFNARLSSTTGFIPIKENNIKIYPNPSNGIFNLEINNAENNTYTVKVFDIIGVTVYSKTITGTSYIKEQIDIAHNAKGMYFLSIESDNGSVISKRIIIK
ncbi:MAG: T9SS type A sorting domain-containing protein [Bacteroidales bacterium]|nr:T9SS type A sorting domain-containing protein [Bacteroidales bacterium]